MNLHDENIILVTDIDPLLRIQALKYFANYSELSPIISNYLSDPVDIVRKVCLELISENNLILPSYQIITTLLADIEWTVRIEAIKVLWLLVLSNPLNITSIRNLPLKDDAFLRLCDMVNDNNTKVRIQAIKTLGLFKNVDTDILLQTLDKQKLSSLKVEPKRIESKAILDPGDFEIESEKEFVNVFDAGAYGAFIHGLEDEFRLVRLASIDSICELSFTSRSFMLKSINFLMDMFIDEDDSVRLLSVNAICKIVANKSDGMLKIDNEQVNDSISIIQDSSIPSRLSAYKMIGFIYLIHRMFTMSLEGLDLMREALFKNIKRYPADLVPIYECFASLGRNHAKFIQAQVPKMLNLDSKYLPIHMSILDPLYKCNFILILNAAFKIPSINEMLPPYTLNHKTYFEFEYPTCIPNIAPFNLEETTKEDVFERLKEILLVLNSLSSGGKIKDQVKTLTLGKRTNTRLKVLLEFVAELLDVMITMKMVIHSMTSSLIRQDMHSHSSLLLKCLYFIQFSYYGYPRSFFKVFQEIRVFAGLLYLIDLIKREAPKNVLQNFIYSLDLQVSRIKGESKVSSYYSKLKNNLQVPKLEQISLVQAALLKFPIPKIEIQNLIKKPIVEISLYKIEDNKTVEILEPLTVPAEIHNPILVVGKVNIDFLGNFAVKIEYPVREGSMFYTIRKNILLVRPPSDEYPINFSFVQGVEPEMDSDYKIMQSGKMSHYSHVGDQVVCDSGTVWIEIPAKARCTALFKFRRVLVKKSIVLPPPNIMLDSAVEEFLVSNNYGKYKTQFARHHITNDMFTDISYQDLKEIGIPSINDRARLALLIAQTCHPQKRAVGKKKTSLKPPTTPLVITPRSTSMKTPSLNSAMFESPASAQPSISSKKKLSLDTKDLSSPKIDPVSPLAQLKSLGFLPDERRSADEKREFVSDILDMDHRFIRINGINSQHTIDVSNLEDAQQIRNKIYHKFNLLDDPFKSSYAIFASDQTKKDGAMISIDDSELLRICKNVNNPYRMHLTIRKQYAPSATEQPLQRRETNTLGSPSTPTRTSPSWKLGKLFSRSEQPTIPSRQESTISPSSVLVSNESLNKRNTRKSMSKKLIDFFGERPPDEMIADQLEQFFPGITQRQSQQLNNPAEPIKSDEEEEEAENDIIVQADIKNIVQEAIKNRRMSRVNTRQSVMSRRMTAVKSTLFNRKSQAPRISEAKFDEDKETQETLNIPSTPSSGIIPAISKAGSVSTSSRTSSNPSGSAVVSRTSVAFGESATGSLPTLPTSPSTPQTPFKKYPEVPEERILAPVLRWEQGRMIGQGAFGRVFFGINLDTGEFLAIKQVVIGGADDPNKKKREDALRRELELLKELDHEYIVRYLGFDISGNFFNVFLEYVSGGSVASLLSKFGKFDDELTASLTCQILFGLEYLHDKKIIHRDIKGGNILVDSMGVTKITDFGISKKNEYDTAYQRATRMSMQGSIYWMAPEVAKGKGYSAKVDIWSTGCLVLEMLTGHQPWHKVPGNVIYFLGKGQSPPVPAELGELAQNFIKLCFTADPEKRPTATELVMDHFVQIDPTAFDFREWYDAAVESKVNQESESSYSDSSEDESYDSNDDKDNSVSDEKSTEIREDESDDYDDDIVTGYGENFDDQGEQDDIVTGYEGEEVDTLTGGHEAEIIEALRMQRDDEDESDN